MSCCERTKFLRPSLRLRHQIPADDACDGLPPQDGDSRPVTLWVGAISNAVASMQQRQVPTKVTSETVEYGPHIPTLIDLAEDGTFESKSPPQRGGVSWGREPYGSLRLAWRGAPQRGGEYTRPDSKAKALAYTRHVEAICVEVRVDYAGCQVDHEVVIIPGRCRRRGRAQRIAQRPALTD